MGLDCSKLAFGSGKSEAELQMDVASCACSNDFFRSTVTCVIVACSLKGVLSVDMLLRSAFDSCVQCAPQTFTQFADGYTPRQVVEMAASQCKALGREISGVDFSSLDGAAGDNAEDDSTASDNDKALEPSEGPGADDGNGNSIPPDPTPFLGSDDGIEPHESSEIESDDGVTPTASSDSGATFIPASSAAAATTPQGTGAGVAAVQAQQILAITVAFGVGAAYLF